MTSRASSPAPGTAAARPAPGIIALALWFGLSTGFAILAALAHAKLVRHRYLHASADFPWAVPLSIVFLFLGAAAILWLAGRGWSRLATLPMRAGAFTALGALSILYQPIGLHRGAAALLALGIGWRVGAFITARQPLLTTVVRRSLPVLLLLFFALVGGTFFLRVRAERRALAALGAAAPNAPNVLLLVLDTVRASSMSLYGFSKPTSPELEQLAALGVRFDDAYSTAPWTLPSHASMMTGQWASALSADWTRPLDGTYPTLAEYFTGRGYITAGFVANTWYCGVESGLARGFAHYEDEPVSFWPIFRTTAIGKALADGLWLRHAAGTYHKFGRKTAPEVNASVLRWLTRHRERPTFTFVNYFDAHGPYDPPAPFDSLFDARQPRTNPDLHSTTDWAPEEIVAQKNAYDASIAYLDHMLGRLFDDLKAQGLLENTIVVVTADHGEEFHGHGVMEHGNSLYRNAVHVPLLISWPGHLPAGAVVQAPVSLREIAHTLVATATPSDPANPFPGRSLTRFVGPGADTMTGTNDTIQIAVSFASGLPSGYPVSGGPLASVVHGGLRLIVDSAGHEELYDERRDPHEQHNLAADPAFTGQLRELRLQIEGHRAPSP